MKLRERIKHHLGLGYVFLYPPENDFNFIAGNLHKAPLLSKLMCWAGRHDLEFVTPVDLGNDGRWVYELECFYCKRKRRSRARFSSIAGLRK